MKTRLLFSLLIAFNSSLAGALTLSLPIQCQLGEECFIQKFVDMAPGDTYEDFRCQHMTSDKHKGTDFRLKDFTELDRNIPVLAAADGVVAALRDGEPDINVNDNPNYDPSKGCGNAVILRHEKKWTSWYCHLKQGSIAVENGQKILAGDVLGYVGLSGNTEFPHLHFQIEQNKTPVDPFTLSGMESGCGKDQKSTLWSKEAQTKLAATINETTAILNYGISGDEITDAKKARSGGYALQTLRRDADALILWVDIMGTEDKDSLDIEIIYPDNSLKIMRHEFTKNQAQYFLTQGARRMAPEWIKGNYRVTLTYRRGGKSIFTKKFDFDVQ